MYNERYKLSLHNKKKGVLIMGNLKHTIKTAAVSSVITASAVLSVCGIVLGSSADAQNLFNTDVNATSKV